LNLPAVNVKGNSMDEDNKLKAWLCCFTVLVVVVVVVVVVVPVPPLPLPLLITRVFQFEE
jgi:flagellar biosynthesis component FlhA